ncbi:MAG: caspase family protein [Candidatus Methanofastidiosia archaeon]
MVVVAILISAALRDPVEGWAVLMETNDFPGGYTDLPVGFVDVERMETLLQYHGWQKSHILVKRDNITPQAVREGIEYLQGADQNDIALFYICSHGGYLRYDLKWNSLMPPLWDSITSEKRVLIIDSCYAGSFLPESERSYIGIGSVSPEELGWAGIPEENLPITGFVFTYYFCQSTRGVSVEEGFEKTVPQVKQYMQEVVYPAFKDIYPPEYYNIYDPHPVLKDSYPGELSLWVDESRAVLSHVIVTVLVLVVLGTILALNRRRIRSYG